MIVPNQTMMIGVVVFGCLYAWNRKGCIGRHSDTQVSEIFRKWWLR